MVAMEKCHTCGREEMITGLRQLWDKNGKFELECWPCWEKKNLPKEMLAGEGGLMSDPSY